MTYAELVAAISDYTENEFPTASVNTFIQQAEQRIYNAVQFPVARKNTTVQTTASDAYLACPTDFLAVYAIAVIDGTGSYEFLINKDASFVRAAYPSPTATGTPRYYALFGPTVAGSPTPVPTNELRFILAPTPNAVYSVELQYYYYPTSITLNSVAGNTTWLSDNLDSVLLYGSLVEAYTYMKGEADILALYEGKYKEALMLAKRLGDGLEGRDAYRNGQIKVPVT